jgi:hypothetical protein
MLTFSMGRSPAWRSLSGAAVKVFIELRCHFDGSNNGKLFLSYSDAAERLRIGKSTVKRAFDELQAKGFIRKTRQGARHCRLASTWAVLDVPLNDGEPAPNDWRRWQPGRQKQNVGTEAAQTLTNGAAAGPIQANRAA